MREGLPLRRRPPGPSQRAAANRGSRITTSGSWALVLRDADDMAPMNVFSPTFERSAAALACIVCGIPAIPAYHHNHGGAVFHSNCCTHQRCLTAAAA